ncbi:MAG: hypothetical protein IPL32_04620 [Chloracidobacterium sp.]|nr:hypothetical protein [Chloracidobacterium sp.]
MKKIISTIVMSLMVAAAIPMMSISADAQTRSCQTRSHYKSNGHDNGLHKGWYKNKKRGNREYRSANYSDRYNDNGYYNYNDGRPNVYQRHRKAMNIGIGTGAGAILGALIGGKKGALIGAAAGAGGGYIATKIQKPKNYRRY